MKERLSVLILISDIPKKTFYVEWGSFCSYFCIEFYKNVDVTVSQIRTQRS
jgi:hypothetical protein